MSKSDNTIKRIVMTVDQFYKHDEQDEQYAYGFDMSTNEPVRIRMSSSEEFTKIINKLNKHHTENVSVDEVHAKFDSGRNQRTSLDTHNRGANRGRIICFDKCVDSPNESLDGYKTYVAQWCNVMSNNPNSQLIKSVTSINVHQQKNGDFFVKAQIIEDAAHMQVPNVKINSPALHNAIIKNNLQLLVKSLSNSTDNQPERIPFSKIVVRYESGSVLTTIPLIPTYDSADRESVKQFAKPDPLMQRGGIDKTKKSYRVAKDPIESIKDILNGNDFHTATFDPNFVPSNQYEKDQFDKQAQNVYVMDQARIALFALLGDRQIKVFYNEDVDKEKNQNLKRLYAGLVSQKLLPEVYHGQQLQLGALYKDTFLKKFFNNKTPHAGFRKVDPEIDLRTGEGVRGVGAPPLVNQFTDDYGNPKPHDLNPQFLSQVDRQTMNKLTHAKQQFAEAFIVIQPHQRNSNNCFVSFIEPVELTQTRMNALNFSEITVEHVQQHKASIDSPLSKNFNHDLLPDPQELMMKVRQPEMDVKKSQEKAATSDVYNDMTF